MYCEFYIVFVKNISSHLFYLNHTNANEYAYSVIHGSKHVYVYYSC